MVRRQDGWLVHWRVVGFGDAPCIGVRPGKRGGKPGPDQKPEDSASPQVDPSSDH